MQRTRLRPLTPAFRGAVTPAPRVIYAGAPRAQGLYGPSTQHTGASRVSNQLASWQPYRSSADADLTYELDTLVSRSRDLARNNGIAGGAIQTFADNIIGTNFRLVSLPDWRALGQTREWAEEWSANVEALWRMYAETTAIDVARRQTFAELSITFLKSTFLNGAGLALPIWQKERYDNFATRIFLLEPDRLCNPSDTMDTASRRGGIDIDIYGRPLGYWIRDTHPGDAVMGISPPGVWTRIPAETGWGRKRVIHAAEIERPGQTRGKPIFSAVMQQFKMIDRYQNAELDATVTNALIAAFVETPMDFGDLVAMLNPESGGVVPVPGDPNYVNPLDYFAQTGLPQNRAKLASGSIMPLYPGEKISSFNPGRPSTGFGPFMEVALRHIATGLNLPYELLTKDFTKTNYSSARAAMLEAWRFFKGKREWLARNWAKPVFTLWLEEAVNAGLVDAPNFYEMLPCYTRARWIGAARGWVDPVKEATAAQIRVETGLSTMETECAEQEGDWEEVMHQQAREQELRRELGLPEYAPPHTVQVVETPGTDPSLDDDASTTGADQAADASETTETA